MIPGARISLTGADAEHLDLIDVLYIIEEIKQLKSRYFQAVDEKDYTNLAGMFTHDAVVDFSGEPAHHVGHHGVQSSDRDETSWRVVGGAEASRVIAGAVQDITTVHQGHDPQIIITGTNSAHGRWTLYDRLEFPEETMHGFGHYHETYERQNGEWRFASLLLTRLSVVWSPTLAR